MSSIYAGKFTWILMTFSEAHVIIIMQQVELKSVSLTGSCYYSEYNLYKHLKPKINVFILFIFLGGGGEPMH